MTHTPARLVGLVASVALSLLVSGCGAATGDLTGVVTYRNQPVASGSITAVGVDGIPHGVAIGPDGRYALTGLPLGEVKITISSPNPATLGRGAGRNNEGRPPPKREAPPPDPEAAKKWFPIPESYADISKTTLRAVVKAGASVHNVEIP